MILTKHFDLFEFMPDGVQEKDAPDAVVANLTVLARTILEPLRQHFGLPIVIHSGYRPPAKNAAVGGVAASDHLTGSAADFSVSPSPPVGSWEGNTIAAFDWLRTSGLPFGQLILEDHREHYGDPASLWVHVSLRTEKHDGTDADKNRLLLSYAPKQYQPWKAAGVA